VSIPTPAEYVAQLQTANGPEEIEAIATALYNSLNTTTNQRTTANKLSPYNKAVAAAFPVDSLVDGVNAYHQIKADGSNWFRHLHFKFTTNQLQSTFQTYNNQRSNQLEASMDNPAIVDAEKFLACIEDCLNSDDAYQVSAGLIAASGRRAIEVWELGKFTKTDDAYTVKFKGQAKRRDYDVPEAERLEYPIRLLIPAKRFLAAFRAFKKHQKYAEYQTTMTARKAELKADGHTPESIEAELRKTFHNIRGRSIDRAVKRSFGASGALENLDSIADGHETSSHVLRHAAVNLLTYRDVQSNAIGKQLKFAAEQLGHFVSGEDSISAVLTSIGYINFEVKGTMPTTTTEPTKETKPRANTSQLRVNQSDRDTFNEIAADLGASNQQEAFHLMVQQWGRVAELERELANLRQNTTAPAEQPETVTKEPEPMTTEPTLTAAAVQEMIAAAMAQVLAQTTTAPAEQPAATVAPAEQPAATVAPVEPTTPPADAAAVAPEPANRYSLKRKIDSRGEDALAKVDAAYWAVAGFNEKQLTDADKWYIGPRLLKDLTGVNYAIVKRWFADHETTVTEHNERHDLNSNHNRRHGKNNLTINDVVKL
jgi:hypothetical protein